MNRRTNKTTGLTLIELMVALAVTAMLVTASLGTMTTLTRLDAAERLRDESTRGTPQLRRLFEADIAHAKRFRSTGTGFAIQTLNAVDSMSMEVEHLPVTVEYTVRDLSGTRWLVRTQRADTGIRFDELVAPGIDSVTLSSANTKRNHSGWNILEAEAIVTVTFDNRTRQPAIFTIR